MDADRLCQTLFAIEGRVGQRKLMVKRILRKYKYPPDQQDAAVELVLEQVERLGESWG